MAKKETKSVPKGKALESRPPVVAVLGHVDHGKTTLLDAIRRTSVAASEAGGITQHIGAYQIKIKNQKSQIQKITFIDTPGHLAFSKMRSRGAKVADLVALVVAADEGVKPQTLESLKHIQSARVPYLVALTKIDLPDKNLERVKKDLARHGVLVEGHGGDIVAVPVSGKTGRGIEDLLEMVLILGEMQELEGSENNPFKGVVIESELDFQRGALATILVQDGSLEAGDKIMVEGKTSKVRAMFDENGKKVFLAGPSVPVEVLGFKEAPSVGSKVEKTGSPKKTEGTEEKASAPSEDSGPFVTRKVSEKKPETSEKAENKLKIILKADTLGTLEAITSSFPEEVQLLHSGAGEVNESDVLLAETTGAQIIGFNVKVSGSAKKLAAVEKVKIATFKVIYELLDEIEKKILKILEPTIGEEVLGRAEILEMFEIKKERIAGCRVVEGEIKKTNRLHLTRKEEIIGGCRIKSMKTKKRDIETVKRGEEFGAVLSPQLDFERGDMLISFRKVEES